MINHHGICRKGFNILCPRVFVIRFLFVAEGFLQLFVSLSDFKEKVFCIDRRLIFGFLKRLLINCPSDFVKFLQTFALFCECFFYCILGFLFAVLERLIFRLIVGFVLSLRLCLFIILKLLDDLFFQFFDKFRIGFGKVFNCGDFFLLLFLFLGSRCVSRSGFFSSSIPFITSFVFPVIWI